MKTIYNDLLNKKNTIVVFAVLVVVLFSGCKKSDDEVDSSVIESKLITTRTGEHWSAPIHLSKDLCGGTTVSLLFNDDHTFAYTNTTSCTFSGSWNVDYEVNRSGQFLNLTFNYTYNFSNYQESFALQYSSEQDVFYLFNKSDFTLKPFVKITTNP